MYSTHSLGFLMRLRKLKTEAVSLVLQKMNFTNRNNKEVKQVSQMLMSDTVQSALMNAIDQNLNLDDPSDLKEVKKGILESLKSIGARNSTTKL